MCPSAEYRIFRERRVLRDSHESLPVCHMFVSFTQRAKLKLILSENATRCRRRAKNSYIMFWNDDGTRYF